MLNKKQTFSSINKTTFLTGTPITAKTLREVTHVIKQLSLLQLACAVKKAKNLCLHFGALQGTNLI